MPAPELTSTTVRYLFASTWAPPAQPNGSVNVPGAKVDGLDTAGNLLNLAVWSLREQGLVEVQQLRPVEVETVTVWGGQSFVRVTALDDHTALPGLEGALLAKIREKPDEGVIARFGRRLSDDDKKGLRGSVYALEIGSKSPWGKVVSYCFTEALHAGLVELKGRVFKKPVISDPAGVEALKGRDAEIVEARTKYRKQQEDLDNAVISDCLHAVSWSHQTGPD